MNRLKLQRTPSLLSNFSISDMEEERVIEEVLTTPFEKVIKILLNTKKHLEENSNSSAMVNDLSWVISRIQSHTLYTYEMTDNSMELEKLSKHSHEMKSFIHYLNNYSETKDVRRRNKAAQVSQTVKINSKYVLKKKNTMRGSVVINEAANEINGRRMTDYNSVLSQVPDFKFEDNDVSDLLSPCSPTRSAMNKSHFYPSEKPTLQGSDYDTEKGSSPIKFNIIEAEAEDVVPNDFKILDKDFNIFAFSKQVGRANALVLGATAIFNSLNIDTQLNREYLPNFLKEVKDKYVDNPYHNDLHGLDVCQTLALYVHHSDLIGLISLTEIDVLGIILAGLVHDIGHPGMTNSYQINSISDLAVTYNDKSILENFHIAEAFRILQKSDCNILEHLRKEDFKTLRKRLIESILSTDMVLHAKVNSTLKNKMQMKQISRGINAETLVHPYSDSLFDDQQEVINFLVHAADLSHNSKEFEISYQWTYFLMEEFWKQGDIEKSRELPISFLCDRETASVPKSQVGFIKGIIIPTFDILIDFLPSVSFVRENVDYNLRGWGEIIAREEEENAEKK